MRALLQTDLTWMIPDRLDKLVRVLEHSLCGHLVYITRLTSSFSLTFKFGCGIRIYIHWVDTCKFCHLLEICEREVQSIKLDVLPLPPHC